MPDDRKFKLIKIAIAADNNDTCSFLAAIFSSRITYQPEEDKQSVLHCIAKQSPPCCDAIFRSTLKSLDQLRDVDKNMENPLHYAVRAQNLTFISTFLNNEGSNGNSEKSSYTLTLPLGSEQVEKAFK